MPPQSDPPEFWEASFADKQEMWGLEPARSAVVARDFFLAQGVQTVLIPGIGYGRNARVFTDSGLRVTGIEIARTAIELARRHYGPEVPIYHGSVADMPFDDARYDGIFCYALIHLLDHAARQQLIRDCYRQLAEGGYMVFTALSKTSPTYGQGQFISRDRYEMFGGVRLFFYDQESVRAEFGAVGLMEVSEIEETYPFFLIKCRKAAPEPGHIPAG